MRYSIALLALAASVFAAPVDKRQSSNSTEVSSSDNNNLNGQDLNNGQNLDQNNQFDVNGLDLSSLDANSLDLNDLNIQDILNAVSFQILEQQLLGDNNNINSLSSIDLNNNDLQFNNFDLGQFNDLFESQFNVGSVFQLLEGLQSSNILDSANLEQNNNVIDLNGFANSFNDQFQSSWQSNEVLALIESISGNQNLQQLEDLAALSGLSNNNNINDILGGGSNVVATQIQEVSI